MKKKRNRKKSSLFKRYFKSSAITVLVAFMFFGLTIMIFVAGQWWTDKVDTLTNNAQNIASTYNGIVFDNNNKMDEEHLKITLSIMSQSTVSDYFITDTQGNVILCADEGDKVCDSHNEMTISKAHMDRALNGGFSDYATEDEFGIGRFVVAIPVKSEGEIFAVVFAIEDAVTGFLPYVSSIMTSMFAVMFLALVVVFIAIYFITKGITQPLANMEEVTRHIAKGDFSYRADESYKNRDFGDFAKSLNKMADELAVEEESQRSFIANVSHELKTPMTSIGGFIDGILDGTIPPEEEKRYLRIVSSEVKRLSRMVVSMLNLSKIEAGEISLNATTYDISKQIFETLLSFERRINENKINIEGFEEMGNVLVKADRDLLQQVIYNLFDNAVKFTPENGTITVFAENNGENTTVTIRNSGQGISKEEISRIFERFYKVDKSRSYDVKGVGLGLYIVKTIINMHDGDIIADSVKGMYTEFKFTIPFLS
ncbi:MAG: sensor histidine kinase [Acutalibacteraceae bacterium]